VRDVLAVLGSLLFSVGELSALQGDHSWWFVGFVVAVSVLSSGMLWWRRRAPVVVTLLAVAAYAVAGVSAPEAVALMTTAVRRRDRVLLALTALAYVVYVVRTIVVDDSGLAGPVFGIFLFGSIVAGGAYIGARRDLVATLRERAERAEAERELRVDQARLGERTRIAQEMHDVLAHKVSLVALHAGALEVNPGVGAEQVQRTAAIVRGTAREALEDLRRVLGVLRSEAGDDDAVLAPQPGLDGLESLVASSREAGVPVELQVTVTGSPPDLAGRTAYRLVQEALTNVHKHARGAAACVRVSGGAGRGLSVEVTNRPPVSPDSLLPGAGLGLVGLAERVTLAGGVLDVGALPDGGWRVAARMPWPAEGVA
jgi:signal transduction histidine kinase